MEVLQHLLVAGVDDHWFTAAAVDCLTEGWLLGTVVARCVDVPFPLPLERCFFDLAFAASMQRSAAVFFWHVASLAGGNFAPDTPAKSFCFPLSTVGGGTARNTDGTKATLGNLSRGCFEADFTDDVFVSEHAGAFC